MAVQQCGNAALCQPPAQRPHIAARQMHVRIRLRWATARQPTKKPFLPKGAGDGDQQSKQHQGVRQQVVRALRGFHIAGVECRRRCPGGQRNCCIHLQMDRNSVLNKVRLPVCVL